MEDPGNASPSLRARPLCLLSEIAARFVNLLEPQSLYKNYVKYQGVFTAKDIMVRHS